MVAWAGGDIPEITDGPRGKKVPRSGSPGLQSQMLQRLRHEDWPGFLDSWTT